MYALWRPDVIALSLLGIGRRPPPVALPDAFLNHFADALWACSVTAFVAIVWFDASRSSRRSWLGIALVAVLGFECMQLTSFVPGTFDVADLEVSVTAHVCAQFLTKARLGEERENHA